MYHFKYVSKKEAAPYKADLIELINKVQDHVRNTFTFQYTFIGSSSRNMITYDPTTNIGFTPAPFSFCGSVLFINVS